MPYVLIFGNNYNTITSKCKCKGDNIDELAWWSRQLYYITVPATLPKIFINYYDHDTVNITYCSALYHKCICNYQFVYHDCGAVFHKCICSESMNYLCRSDECVNKKTMSEAIDDYIYKKQKQAAITHRNELNKSANQARREHINSHRSRFRNNTRQQNNNIHVKQHKYKKLYR